MKSKSLGAIHPILFAATMYVVTLLFSIFICSSLFYSCNTTAKPTVEKSIPAPVVDNAVAVK